MCTRPCTRPLYMVVDTAVYGLCTLYTTVYVYGCTCTGAVYSAVYTALYGTCPRPCTDRLHEYTTVYTTCRCTRLSVHSPCTQPCTRTVHGPEHRQYTAVGTASTRPSIRITALVTEDVEEVMLGTDWLEANDCVWDFKTGKLCIGGQPATTLSRCGYIKCRRVLV